MNAADQPPRLLHRYFRDSGEITLENGTLKTNAVHLFNDPFEYMFRAAKSHSRERAAMLFESRVQPGGLLYGLVQHFLPHISDPEAFMRLHREEAINALLRNQSSIVADLANSGHEIAEKYVRVLCCTKADLKPLDEILLWSHYAGNHSGYRMSFQFPPPSECGFKFSRVRYRNERPILDFLDLYDAPEEKAIAAVKSALLTKSKAWEYEQEYRALVHPEMLRSELIKGITHYFIEFDSKWLRGVDFGIRCPDEIKNGLTEILKKEYPHALLRKAEFHVTDYSLTYKQI